MFSMISGLGSKFTNRIDAKDILWALLVAVQIGIVFSVPVFPSEDGPMHLYYIDAIQGIVHHQQPYLDYFEFKRVPPPYLFHYGAILLLERILAPLAAEKLLIALYVIWLGVAFRYLARPLGPGWRQASLLAVPFSLNYPIYMGFLNFSLGIATSLFLIGFWIRYHRRLSPVKSVLFGAGFLVTASMHPLAILIFVMFVASHTTLVFARALRETPGYWTHRIVVSVRQISSLALPVSLTLLFVLWVLATVHGTELLPPTHYSLSLLPKIKAFALCAEIFPVSSRTYRYPVVLLLGVVVLVTIGRIWRRPAICSMPACSLVSMVGLCFIAYCAVPNTAAGSAVVAPRFAVAAVFFTLALTAVAPMEGTYGRGVLLGVTLIGLTMSVELFWVTRRIATEIRPLLEAPVMPRGSKGLILFTDRDEFCQNCRFWPYPYAGAHYFRRSGAVLLNSPWTTLPVMPITLRDNSLGDHLNLAKLPSDFGSDFGSLLDFILVVQNRPGVEAEIPLQLIKRARMARVPLQSERFLLFAVPGRMHWADVSPR